MPPIQVPLNGPWVVYEVHLWKSNSASLNNHPWLISLLPNQVLLLLNKGINSFYSQSSHTECNSNVFFFGFFWVFWGFFYFFIFFLTFLFDRLIIEFPYAYSLEGVLQRWTSKMINFYLTFKWREMFTDILKVMCQIFIYGLVNKGYCLAIWDEHSKYLR